MEAGVSVTSNNQFRRYVDSTSQQHGKKHGFVFHNRLDIDKLSM